MIHLHKNSNDNNKFTKYYFKKFWIIITNTLSISLNFLLIAGINNNCNLQRWSSTWHIFPEQLSNVSFMFEIPLYSESRLFPFNAVYWSPGTHVLIRLHKSSLTLGLVLNPPGMVCLRGVIRTWRRLSPLGGGRYCLWECSPSYGICPLNQWSNY